MRCASVTSFAYSLVLNQSEARICLFGGKNAKDSVGLKKMASNRTCEFSAEIKTGNRLSLKRSRDESLSGNVAVDSGNKQDNSGAKMLSGQCKPKEKRKANWTTLETSTLVMQVMENYDVINANHAGSERVESQKKKVWADIVDLVNRLVVSFGIASLVHG